MFNGKTHYKWQCSITRGYLVTALSCCRIDVEYDDDDDDVQMMAVKYHWLCGASIIVNHHTPGIMMIILWSLSSPFSWALSRSPFHCRMLQEKVTDLEVQIAESLLSSSYHASQCFGRRWSSAQGSPVAGKPQKKLNVFVVVSGL